MISRRVPAVLLASALAFALTGCIGAADAKPSASRTVAAFKSDAEAYAAAEKVYRDYVEAYNQVDTAKPATFAPVFELSTGSANAADRKMLSGFHADHVTLTGTAVVDSATHASINDSRRSVSIAVCTDVSAIDIRDAAGTSLVSRDRPAKQALLVTVDDSSGAGTFKVAEVAGREGAPACR